MNFCNNLRGCFKMISFEKSKEYIYDDRKYDTNDYHATNRSVDLCSITFRFKIKGSITKPIEPIPKKSNDQACY